MLTIWSSVDGWARRWWLLIPVLIWSSCRLLLVWSTKTRRPCEKERERQNEPYKHDHPSTPSISTTSCLRRSWKAIGETLWVRACTLRVPQQIKQTIHRCLMTKDAFTGVVSPATLVTHDWLFTVTVVTRNDLSWSAIILEIAVNRWKESTFEFSEKNI